MKTPLAAVLATLAVPACAQTCATVEVDNVRPQRGQLMVAAYASADDFARKPAVALRVPAAEARMRIELCGLQGPAVALTLFQDLDGDGKLNKNLIGVPTEPWGASGKPGPMGPAWDTAKVALDGQPIAVRLSQ